ncbi:MAG: alcohol dehydrogenase [Chloroflexi bacterium]|nr:alcohol dehydrogenase [Chloroflexota bacterium]|tara:strand:- start:3034 stop:3972 length:939 start_codon:yes stop_codon:yes gene_type:complete
MFTVKQPSKIIFGKNSGSEFDFPKDCLVITSSGAKKRNWLSYLNLNPDLIFDQVESNPSINTTENIIDIFKNSNFSTIVGIGGGSVLDVAKFVAYKMNKLKILIPTNFGSGSEVTRISVLKVNGLKKSFHDDKLFADIAIVDSNFIHETNEVVFKNSVIDACAQCTEAFDSKISNNYTKFLCNKAFDILENAILTQKYDNIPLGSLISGLGFGNSSTTLGHALSYVFSNEGFSHGHSLAYTTTFAHKFNSSKFSERFEKIVDVLNFKKIHLTQNFDTAAKLILTDRKHLDNNPKIVTKDDIIQILKSINQLE